MKKYVLLLLLSSIISFNHCIHGMQQANIQQTELVVCTTIDLTSKLPEANQQNNYVAPNVAQKMGKKQQVILWLKFAGLIFLPCIIFGAAMAIGYAATFGPAYCKASKEYDAWSGIKLQMHGKQDSFQMLFRNHSNHNYNNNDPIITCFHANQSCIMQDVSLLFNVNNSFSSNDIHTYNMLNALNQYRSMC